MNLTSKPCSAQITDQQRAVDEAALTIEKTKKDLEANRSDKLNAVAQADGNLKIAKLNADIPKVLQPLNTFLGYQNTYEKAKLALQKAKEDLANFEAQLRILGWTKPNRKGTSGNQIEENAKRPGAFVGGCSSGWGRHLRR